MDPAIASVVVAAITTSGLLGVAFINAMNDREKAVSKATEPLMEKIKQLRAHIRSLGGDPDDA